MGDFAGSLAQEIENAFRDVRLENGLDAPPADDDARMLYIAIGRGVVAHLRKNANSFTVHVGVTLPGDFHPTISTR
jgi:hypothetical protein